MSTSKPHRRTSLFRRLAADKAGVAFLEFALIAPLLIAFYFGCVEFSLALMSQKRSNHVAAAVGDLVAQQRTVSATSLNDIFRISRTLLAPFATDNLRVRVSHITVDNAGTATFNWGCNKNWSNRNSASGLTFQTIHRNASWIVTEARYSYDSPIGVYMPTLTTFSTQMMHRPRLQNTVTAPNGTYAVACPGTTWA